MTLQELTANQTEHTFGYAGSVLGPDGQSKAGGLGRFFSTLAAAENHYHAVFLDKVVTQPEDDTDEVALKFSDLGYYLVTACYVLAGTPEAIEEFKATGVANHTQLFPVMEAALT